MEEIHGSDIGLTDRYTSNISGNIELPTLTKTGYTFLGWTGSNGATPSKNVTIAKGTKGNLTYTANWEPITYTIVFNGNGGTTGSGETTYTQTFTYDMPQLLYTNKFTNGDLRFFNWYTSSDGTGTRYKQKAVINNLTSSNETINLYAKWGEPVTAGLKVHRVGEGFGWLADQNRVDYSVPMHFFGNTYIGDGLDVVFDSIVYKDGYSKVKFFHDEECKQEIDIDTYTIDDYNIDIYAKTEPDEYSINYYAVDGATNNNPTTYNVKTESFTLKNPTKEGYTFTGWTGTGLNGLTSKVTIEKGTTGNLGYTANWEKTVEPSTPDSDKYTVTVNYGKGISKVNGTMEYEEGSKLDLAAVPKPGYQNPKFLDKDGKEIDLSTYKMPGENITISVEASPITYKIEYDANGGTLSTSNPTTYTVETDTFTLNNPTKSGYTFKGWTKDSSDTPKTTVKIEKGTTGDLKYTANWEAISDKPGDDGDGSGSGTGTGTGSGNSSTGTGTGSGNGSTGSGSSSGDGSASGKMPNTDATSTGIISAIAAVAVLGTVSLIKYKKYKRILR